MAKNGGFSAPLLVVWTKSSVDSYFRSLSKSAFLQEFQPLPEHQSKKLNLVSSPTDSSFITEISGLGAALIVKLKHGLPTLALALLLMSCFNQKSSEQPEVDSTTATTSVGTQAVVSPNTRPPVGSKGTIVVAPGEPVATAINSQTLGIPSGIRPAGAPVNTSSQSATAGQIILSIPYDPNYKQTSLLALAGDADNVVVFYHVQDANGGNTVGAIPARQLTFNDDHVSFVSRGEGNYQAAILPEPVVEEITKEVTTPAYNPSVLPATPATVEFTSVSLVITSGREVRLTASYTTPNGISLERCVAVLDENKNFPLDQSVSDSTFDVALTVFKSGAHTTHGQYQCQDSHGRSVTSPWSSGVAIAELTLPTMTMAPTGVAADGWVNHIERSNTSAWLTYSNTNTQTVSFTSFQTTPSVCSSAQDYHLSAPPTVNALASDGTYWICAKATSPDSGVLYFTSPSFVRDTQAPSVSFPIFADSKGVISLSATATGHNALTWSSLPAGSFSSTSSPTTVFTASASGSYSITLTATDVAGNIGALSRNVIVDADAPVIASVAPIDTLFNIASHAAQTNSALFTVTASDANAMTYSYSDFLASGLCDASQIYNSTMPKVGSLTSETPVYICVRATDSVGNVAYQQSGTTRADLTVPLITFNSIPVITAANHNAVTLSGSCDENGQNVVISGDHSDSATCAAGSWSVSANLSAKSDGVLNFVVAMSDAAGNLSSINQTANKNANPATATISGQPSGTSKVTSATINFAGIGAVAIKYKIVSGNTCTSVVFAGSEVSTGPQNLDWSTQPDGPVSICAIAKNAVGNWQLAVATNVTWTKDTTAPSFISLLGANGASDGYVNSSEESSSSPLLNLVASDYVSADYSLVLANSALTCDESKTYASSSVPLINTIPAVDGAYAVCLRLQDAAGNTSYHKSTSITRDTNAPSVNVGVDVTTGALYAINATTSGGSSHAWTKQSGVGAITFGTPSAEDTTVTASAEDVYTLRLTVADAAGNISYDELTFTWDVTAPVFTSLNWTGDASDGYVNNAEKNNVTVLWTLAASGYTSINYTAPLDDTSSVTCDASKTYSQPLIASAADLSGGDKPYVICAKLLDAAGNITYGKSAVVVRDTAPPTVSLIDQPTGTIYNQASIDVTVGGATATHYRHAMIASAGADCSIASYGVETSVATHITNALTNTPGNTNYTLCVIARDVANNYQLVSAATRADWTLANSAVTISSAPSYANSSNFTAFPINGTCQYGSGNVTVRFNATIVSSSITCSADSWSTSLNVTSITDSITPYSVTAEYSGKTSTSVSVAKDIGAPSPDTLNVGTVTASTVALSWSASDTVSGIASYRLYYSTSPTMNTVAQVEGATPFGTASLATGVTVTDLASGTPYYFNVVINDQAGNKSVMSPQNATPTSDDDPHFTKLSAGSKHVCAIDDKKELYCWGSPEQHRLGDGAGVNRFRPYPVAISDQFDSISAGGSHTCALTLNGTAYCWGANNGGQIGNGNTTEQTTPAPVSTSVKFSKIVAGNSTNTCAIARSDDASYPNALYCWGANINGQVGNGSIGANVTTPYRLTIGEWKDVAVGSNTVCGITNTDKIQCWGSNANGLTAQGVATGNTLTPTQIQNDGGNTFTQVALGMFHACALTVSGSVLCWGKNQTFGLLGNWNATLDTSTIVYQPTAITNNSGAALGVSFSKISIRASASCGLAVGGEIYCWGNNNNFMHATETGAHYNYARNTTLTNYSLITVGDYMVCGLNAGVAKCWGSQDDDSQPFGLLGNNINTVGNSAAPVLVDLTELSN